MKIAFLTAGGIAPCLSSSIGALIEQYAKSKPDAEMIGYLNGYRGLLLGQSIEFPASIKENFATLYAYGGSPIGNSRVKLTNIQDCIDRDYVKEGEEPLQVAAEQLKKDKVDISNVFVPVKLTIVKNRDNFLYCLYFSSIKIEVNIE